MIDIIRKDPLIVQNMNNSNYKFPLFQQTPRSKKSVLERLGDINQMYQTFSKKRSMPIF